MLALLFVIRNESPEPPPLGDRAAGSHPLPAWLEAVGGCRIRLARTCMIGRARKNDLVLPSNCISRRHALIKVRGNGAHWLSDLGSRNGTWVNGSRIAHAVRLRDGDRVGIAQMVFRFRQTPFLYTRHGMGNLPPSACD